jgi:tRNA pseudouridine55 synthase
MDKLNGFLLINKPLGITSFQVIRILRKVTGIQKMGHGGTLDKNATGLLMIGVGKGTKKLTELLAMDKTYLFRLQFGKESETGDMLGCSWSYQGVSPTQVSESSLKKVIQERFLGEIQQIPPVYSALKKNGQRLSDLARNDIPVNPEPRAVTIHECKLLHFSYDSYQPSAVIRLSCSHGTYIRSICRDIGHALGTVACMTSLFRTRLGPYHVAFASPVASITSAEILERSLIC